MTKKIFMIAGPNGAGKTTTALSLIPNAEVIYEFLNADEIARGLAPLHPESVSLTASKLMINRFKGLLDANKSFVFETTASGMNYIKHLKNAQANGYEIQLLFLWLYSPELAIMRVEHRVSQGGHNIPEETIIRRYYSGIKNLIQHYLPLSDGALILDNSKAGLNNVIARKDVKGELTIVEPNIWKEIEGIAHGTEA
jgi:predicted ABC-type ATPase